MSGLKVVSFGCITFFWYPRFVRACCVGDLVEFLSQKECVDRILFVSRSGVTPECLCALLCDGCGTSAYREIDGAGL